MTTAQDPELSKQIAQIVRSTRKEAAWSQHELARRLGSSQSTIQRLESGQSVLIDSSLISAVLRELGIRVDFNAQTIGLAGRREQRDIVHAACCAYARRRMTALGWDARVEVEVGRGRFRGWIDLIAYRDQDGCLLCVEIKTEIDDVGRILRTVGWYEREAAAAARQFGWRPRSTTVALLALESTANDRSIARNFALLHRMFPMSATSLSHWMALAGTPPPSGALALIDPRSRRRDWLRSTLSGGRRTAAAYEAYRDAAVALTTPRRRGR